MTEITSRLTAALADRYKIERHLGEGGMDVVDGVLEGDVIERIEWRAADQ